MNLPRYALVTGASSGIGRAYARSLASRGYEMLLLARREDRLRELAEELAVRYGVASKVIVADLATPEGRATAANHATKVDAVVNSAGFPGYGRFSEVALSTIVDLIDVHVLAALETTRAALPHMLVRNTGAIVNVASGLAFSGALPPGDLPSRATYAGAKSFLVTFTRALAQEIVDSDVQVQVLCPGRTTTELHSGEFLPYEMSAEDVVTASVVGLCRREVICAPALEDVELLNRFALVEESLLRGCNQSKLASRYLSDSSAP